MLGPNLNSSSVLWKKLDRVKDGVIVRIFNFFRATQGRGEEWEGGCEIVLIELNPIYAVPKFELAKCLMKKVGQSQRLCNCVNSQIFRATHGQGGPMETGWWNLVNRVQPYLCCGQI